MHKDKFVEYLVENLNDNELIDFILEVVNFKDDVTFEYELFSAIGIDYQDKYGEVIDALVENN